MRLLSIISLLSISSVCYCSLDPVTPIKANKNSAIAVTPIDFTKKSKGFVSVINNRLCECPINHEQDLAGNYFHNEELGQTMLNYESFRKKMNSRIAILKSLSANDINEDLYDDPSINDNADNNYDISGLSFLASVIDEFIEIDETQVQKNRREYFNVRDRSVAEVKENL